MAIHGNVKFTLDGKTKFTVGDTKYVWSDHWIDMVNIWSDDKGSKPYTSTVTLKGGDWGMWIMDFAGSHNMQVVLKDADAADGRHIQDLHLGNVGNTVILKSTEIGTLDGGDGIDKFTLGSGRIDTVYTRDGDDVVKCGAGSVGSVYTSGGDDTVTTGNGDVNQITLGDGNNTVNVTGTGFTGQIIAFDGNDIANISGKSVDSLNFGSGNNTFNISGAAHVSSLTAYDGDDHVNLSTSGSVDSINIGDGDNTLTATGSGWIGTVLSYEGDDIVNLEGSTAQYAGSLYLGNGNNTVVTGNVFVEAMTTGGGNDTMTIGSGGAGQIVSWGGDNTLTSSGWIASIVFRGGNDTVNLLDGGTALSIVLGDGDDKLSVSEVTDPDLVDQPCAFNGGKGNDTVDFRQFTHDISIFLPVSSTSFSGHGVFKLIGFENAIGGGGNDTIQGDLAGNILEGGKGNDSLSGGQGADTFVFASGDGDDTITDFTASESDMIDLSAMTQITDFADLSTNHMQKSGSDVVIDNGAGDTITITGVALSDLTAERFIFA
jgi:hypothetical protein